MTILGKKHDLLFIYSKQTIPGKSSNSNTNQQFQIIFPITIPLLHSSGVHVNKIKVNKRVRKMTRNIGKIVKWFSCIRVVWFFDTSSSFSIKFNVSKYWKNSRKLIAVSKSGTKIHLINLKSWKKSHGFIWNAIFAFKFIWRKTNESKQTK